MTQTHTSPTSNKPATAIIDVLAQLPDDFMADGREDSPPQERDGF